ncbi:hypothetical protein NDU88_004881 [Pleurodeles waltl]|uniref:Uncharacterized protein n=1 Tax=Pleurodeles waltl TaxID=8319 RepID=A0AAV7W7Z3_PLEWA|nr:hypothetical protein NDU88_004881 [Pleurodeles waltl]
MIGFPIGVPAVFAPARTRALIPFPADQPFPFKAWRHFATGCSHVDRSPFFPVLNRNNEELDVRWILGLFSFGSLVPHFQRGLWISLGSCY